MSKLESEMRSEKNVALFVREHTLKRESLRVVLGSCCCHGTGIKTERFTDLPARFDSADLSIHKEQMAQMSSTLEEGVISCCFIVSEGEEGDEGTSEEVCTEESQSHAQCTARWSLAASIQQPRRLRWRPLLPKRDGRPRTCQNCG